MQNFKLQNEQTHIFLLGGLFGSGKTTLANKMFEKYPQQTHLIEFGILYNRIGGLAIESSQRGHDYRDSIWMDLLLTSINEGIETKKNIIIATSTFLIADRRRKIITNLQQYNANLYPIIMALDQNLLINRIHSDRKDQTNPINASNIHTNLERMNKIIQSSNNNDIFISPKTESNLSKTNKEIFLCPNHTTKEIQTKSWYLHASQLGITDCEKLMLSQNKSVENFDHILN